MTNEAIRTTTAAAVTNPLRRPFLGRTRSATGAVFKFVPGMIWALIVFMVLGWSVGDMNQVLFGLGAFQVTPLHIVMASMLMLISDFYILIATQRAEKSRVVNKVMITAFVYGILWVLSLGILIINGHVNWLRIFTTAEFAILTVAVIVELFIAIKGLEALSSRFVGVDNSDTLDNIHSS